MPRDWRYFSLKLTRQAHLNLKALKKLAGYKTMHDTLNALLEGSEKAIKGYTELDHIEARRKELQ